MLSRVRVVLKNDKTSYGTGQKFINPMKALNIYPFLSNMTREEIDLHPYILGRASPRASCGTHLNISVLQDPTSVSLSPWVLLRNTIVRLRGSTLLNTRSLSIYDKWRKPLYNVVAIKIHVHHWESWLSSTWFLSLLRELTSVLLEEVKLVLAHSM